MKQELKKMLRHIGGHLFTDASLPTGIDWLLDIKKLAERRHRSLETFFDVGANVGQTTTSIAKAFPNARVCAFEPFQATFHNFCKRTVNLPKVRGFQLALGSSPGTTQVPAVDNSEQNSLCSEGSSHLGDLPLQTVTITTLDQFCGEQGIQAIDVLKTDTEGYDLEVLRGGEALLAAGRIGFIYTEVTFSPVDKTHTAFFPLHALVEANGYRFLGVYDTYSLHHAPESATYCNVLYVNRKWMDDTAAN